MRSAQCAAAPAGAAEKAEKAEKEEDTAEVDKKRLFIFRELVDTERTYCQNLKLLDELYVIPLRESGSSSHAILPQEHLYIFDNVAVMARISAQLMDDLEKALVAWEGSFVDSKATKPLAISTIFTQLLPFMKMYSNYRDQVNFDKMRELYDQYPKFSDFVKKCTADPRVKGLNLDSLLIQPIQRIPRYIMLLESLIKYTKESDADYKGLQSALDEVQKVAGHVNSATAILDDQMMALATEMGQRFEALMEPWRTFVDEAQLKVVEGGKKAGTLCLILLSDILVFARQKNKKKDFSSSLDLISCWLIDVPDTDGIQHSFIVFHPAGQFQFVCESAEEKDSWLSMLMSAIGESIENSRGDKNHRNNLLDQELLAAKKDNHEFYSYATTAAISLTELELLKGVILAPPEPEPKAKGGKEKEKEKERKEKEKEKEKEKKEKKKEKEKEREKEKEEERERRLTKAKEKEKEKEDKKKDKKKEKDCDRARAASKVVAPRDASPPASPGPARAEPQEHEAPRTTIHDRIAAYTDAVRKAETVINVEPLADVPEATAVEEKATMFEQKACEVAAPRDGCVKQGYLTKKGAVVKNWKERYCILTASSLQYYKSSLAQEANGAVDLQQCSVRHTEDMEETMFELVTPARTWVFKAKSKAARDEWVSVIDGQVERNGVLAKIVREGFIVKRGSKVKNWKKRWCILRSATLYYYKNKTDSKPAGQVALAGSTVELVPRENGKGQCISVSSGDRCFLFYGESEEDTSAWEAAVQRHL